MWTCITYIWSIFDREIFGRQSPISTVSFHQKIPIPFSVHFEFYSHYCYVQISVLITVGRWYTIDLRLVRSPRSRVGRSSVINIAASRSRRSAWPLPARVMLSWLWPPSCIKLEGNLQMTAVAETTTALPTTTGEGTAATTSTTTWTPVSTTAGMCIRLYSLNTVISIGM